LRKLKQQWAELYCTDVEAVVKKDSGPYTFVHHATDRGEYRPTVHCCERGWGLNYLERCSLITSPKSSIFDPGAAHGGQFRQAAGLATLSHRRGGLNRNGGIG
jgi:hypothetical protein